MTADTIGGVWTYSLELARALTARGVEVFLATMGAELSPDQAAEALRVPRLHVRESQFKLEWMEEPWSEVDASCEWLLELERELAPDVVHLNTFVHGNLPFRRPPLVVGHSCVLSWWEAVLGEKPPERYATYRRRVRQGLQAAAVVAAPSQAMLGELSRLYGPFDEVAVIPNARDASRFPPAARKEPFILSAGRLWDRAKNLELLERAAHEELPWPVFVAGETQHPNGDRAATHHVRALGKLDWRELAEWMARASIYVLPAKYEPFGLSALEAALSGCALVLGDIPSLREVWGDAARYVAPDNLEALRSVIFELVGDPYERVRLGARARERALTFSPASQVAAYLSLYEYLAAHPLRSATRTALSG